jgi:prephenate dehydrogenase
LLKQLEERLIKVSIIGTGLIGASIGRALVKYSESGAVQSVCEEINPQTEASESFYKGAKETAAKNLSEFVNSPGKLMQGEVINNSENLMQANAADNSGKSPQSVHRKVKFFVTGYDRSNENAAIALKTNAIHRVAPSVQEALQSDITIIAIPVQFILAFLRENALHFRKGSVVMDTGSTKQEVTKAMQKLPHSVEFIGGHPIAGKEKGGPQNADPLLFCGKKFVLTKENRISEKGKNSVLALIRTLGAEPVFMESALHDRILAYTSHFPYLVASALFSLVSGKSAALPEMFKFAGTGLRDTTRIASGDVLMSYGMLETNRENILNALDEFEETLSAFRKAFLSGTLPEKLKKAKEERDKIWK